MKKIGFIGMGNMARAIAEGFVKGKAANAEDLYAYAPHFDKLKSFCAPLGICACKSVAEMLQQVDTVIMAVKPYVVEGVIAEVKEQLKGKAVLSVVAGYTCGKYGTLLDESTRVQYIMPNTPCMVGEGVLLFEEENTLTGEELAQAKGMFEALGEVVSLGTHLMNAGMAISGCGPAFVAMMIEALADAGVKYGLPRPTAYRLASKTLSGTGEMQLKTGMHPGVIKDGVCSPAGTTIRGVEALERAGLRAAMLDAVQAVMEKKP